MNESYSPNVFGNPENGFICINLHINAEIATDKLNKEYL